MSVSLYICVEQKKKKKKSNKKKKKEEEEYIQLTSNTITEETAKVLVWDLISPCR